MEEKVKISRFKKVIYVCISLLLLIVIMVALSDKIAANLGGDLRCKDLSNCTGAAGCEGPGSVTNCEITCDGGGSASCDFK
jgi:hypothetical protein